jgi:zinc/manganese transport system substrate-binding protein
MKSFQLKHVLISVYLLFLMLGLVPHAKAKIKVVTSTEDLAAITQAVGGDKVEVTSLGKGYQNPHFVPPKPSFILKLKDAQLLVTIGMDLDIWLPPLVESSRNRKLFRGNPGYVDASIGIPIQGAPAVRVDRSLGDVHGMGNPHYWLDPVNAKVISSNIVSGLKRVDPANGAYYDQQRQIFLKQLAGKLTGWLTMAKPLKGLKVITYHQSWPYFEKRFGLDTMGYVEPKPGIPPTPKHTQEIIQLIKQNNIKMILVEPYFNRATPDMIAKATGAKVLVIPSSVGGVPGATNYMGLFDTLLSTLLKAQ